MSKRVRLTSLAHLLLKFSEDQNIVDEDGLDNRVAH
jgi:hypothetical protein